MASVGLRRTNVVKVDVLFRGFWSTKWSKAQDRQYDDRRYTDSNKMLPGDIWLGRTVGYFCESVFEPIWVGASQYF
jgi:hypothetical protein